MTTVAGELTSRDVLAGEYYLRVYEAGDKDAPVVLWLHGSGPGVSALSNWERLITTMPGFRHVAPDVLGFGDSAHPDPAPRGMRPYTALRAEVSLALLDALDIERAHVVGNSMGGMITLQMALTAPQRLDRLILMGSGGADGVPPTEALIKMVMFYAEPTPAAMRDLLTSFVYDTSLFAGRLDEIAADRVRVATRPEVRHSHEATFDPGAPGGPVSFQPGQLATLDHQVLLIHGREDRVIPVASSQYLLTHLRNAQLHVLPHAGHWVQIEQADRFRALAQLFLSEAP